MRKRRDAGGGRKLVDGGDDVEALIPRLNQLQRAVASLPRHTNRNATLSYLEAAPNKCNKIGQISPCRHGEKNISRR